MIKSLLPNLNTTTDPTPSTPSGTGFFMVVLISIAIPLTALGKAVAAFALIPAVCVAIFSIDLNKEWGRLKRKILTPMGITVACVFALWAISVLNSLDVSRSLAVWARTILYILAMTVVVTRLANEPPLVPLLQKSLIISSVIILIFILFIIFASDSPLKLLRALGSSKYQGNIAFKAYASAMICLLPFVLWSGYSLGSVWKTVSYMMVPGTLVFIWGTNSKAALLGLLASILLVIVIRLLIISSRRLRHAIVTILLLFTTVGTVSMLANLPQTPVTEDYRYRLPEFLVDHHRQAIWGFVVRKVYEKPIFGHGIDVINQTEGASVYVPNTGQNYVPSHPHNWMIEIGAETGLVGLLAVITALLVMLRRLSVIAASGDPIGWAAVATFAAFWGSGLSNFSIWASWWQMTFLLLMAITFGVAASKNSWPEEVV